MTFALPPLVLVLVAAVDRRILPAIALLPQLVGSEAWALHIAVDADRSFQLARDWMDAGMATLPLRIEEPRGDTLAGAVRRVVGRERPRRPRLTVIVPEMDLGRWWQPLLHRGTGRSIAWELAGAGGVTTVVVPVPVPAALPAGRATMMA